jgi:hypothetical protein
MHLHLILIFQMNLGGQGNTICIGVPVYLGVTGLYDVEFRIVVACRDGCIYLVRRGWTQARSLVQLPAQAVAMVVLPENSSIVVALMNETLHGYSKKVDNHKHLQKFYFLLLTTPVV